MFRLGFTIATRCYWWLQAHSPAARLVYRIQQRPTLAGCALSTALGVILLTGAGLLGQAIRAGAPDWWNLAVLVLFFPGVKLVLAGPLTLARMTVTRMRARIARG